MRVRQKLLISKVYGASVNGGAEVGNEHIILLTVLIGICIFPF